MSRRVRANFASASRGFTLVEVLFALGIITFGMLGIASLLAVGIFQQRQATDDSVGVMTAQNVLSLMRGADHLHSRYFPATADENFVPVTATLPERYEDPSGRYAYSLAYRTRGSGQIQLAVLVHWNDDQDKRPAALGFVSISQTDGTIGGVAADQVGRPGQVILAQPSGRVEAWNLRVISEKRVATPPGLRSDRAIYAPQGAVAIVTGFIR